jgi:hypothetical protein
MLDKDRIRRLLRNPALRPGERYGLEQQLRECKKREEQGGEFRGTELQEGPESLEFDFPLLGLLTAQPARLEPETPKPEPSDSETESELAVVEIEQGESGTSPEEVAEPVAEAVTEDLVEVPVEIVSSLPEPAWSPSESAENVTAKIMDIIDRFFWLKAFWATTLSPEVDREIEAWRARVQRLAAKLKIIDPGAHDLAFAGNENLLAPLRDMRKPTIPESLQQSLIAPSAPNMRDASWRSDIYWAIYEPPVIRKPPLPEGHLPDGLQSFIS